MLLDEDYVRGRKVFGQLVCTFRYGREEDEVMGLNFYKELFLASEQIYPPPEKRNYELSRTQVRNFSLSLDITQADFASKPPAYLVIRIISSRVLPLP